MWHVSAILLDVNVWVLVKLSFIENGQMEGAVLCNQNGYIKSIGFGKFLVF